MNLKMLLPEIIRHIISLLDCKSIIITCRISKNFHDVQLQSLLREYISNTTKLNVNDLSLTDLIRLCRTQLFGSTHISCGRSYSLILKSDNRVYSCGSNEYGCLGLGNYISTSNLVLIPNITNATKVVASNHSSIITSNTQLYRCGKYINIPTVTHYELKDMTYNTMDTFPLLLIDSQIYEYDMKLRTLIPNVLLNNIILYLIQQGSLFALTSSGQIYVRGCNIYGELGINSSDYYIANWTLIPKFSEYNIISIVSNNGSSFILTENDQVYAFGLNNNGRLGLGDKNDRNVPTIIPGLNNIISISTSGYSTLALTKHGRVYGFGKNVHGELGLNDKINRTMPVLHPNLYDIVEISIHAHSLFLTAKGEVYGCGWNLSGQLGLGDDFDRVVPVLITSM